MSYVRPLAEIFQDYSNAPAEATEPLRAHISGGNAKLHRFDVENEKALLALGLYDSAQHTAYSWPDKTVGSIVDQAGARVFIENALLQYLADTIGDATGGRGTVTPVAGHKNRITSSSISFKTNGLSQPRSGLLYDRDVQIGDVVCVRGVTDVENACNEYVLWTAVTGFVADTVAATVFPASLDANNQATNAADFAATQTAGAENCISVSEHGDSAYNGLADGFVSETYTVTVTRSSVAGCAAARLRVTSASGTDNVAEVDPGTLGEAVPIGTRGLQIQFDVGSGACETAADEAGVAATELVVGQTWEITVEQTFERTCVLAGDTFTGDFDDTYVIEVTKGGTWAEAPQVTITTTKGLDASGPTTVTGINTDITAGSHGLTFQFADCGNLPDSASIEVHDDVGMGNDALAGLRKGDKFYITVATGANGPMRTLVLQDDLPVELADATDLDLRLFIVKTIEVSENRVSAPPLVNYTTSATQLTLKSGITAYDASWTNNGLELPLSVYDGQSSTLTNAGDYGTVYVDYSEWLSDVADAIHFIDSVGDLDVIPGQLDVRNPLKWGVYKALQNANGTRVAYTAVADPTSVDSWQVVVNLLNGRDDVYNYVPLTHDATVIGLFVAQAQASSAPEYSNFKGVFFGLSVDAAVMRVGKSSTSAQALRPTSTNGGVVLATLSDDPASSGTQYTLLSVPANNSGFITYGVRPGDIVRFLFTIDAFGATQYTEFVVDTVLSQNSLRLVSGHTSAITVAQKMEIWHTQSTDDLVTAVTGTAQTYSSRRVVAVWPDVAGTAGVAQASYHLAAALAGAVSGVAPHQGLTNVQILGFDDLASRTKDLFTGAQLDRMAAGGVWICTEDNNGTPHTRHALTTDMTDLNSQEEAIRRNVDSMSFAVLHDVQSLVGRANATPSVLSLLRYRVMKRMISLQTDKFTTMLGPQLIAGSIALDESGAEILRIHPLFRDRVEIVLNWTVPAPLNNIQVHLVV